MPGGDDQPGHRLGCVELDVVPRAAHGGVAQPQGRKARAQTGIPLQNVTYSRPGQWYGMEFDTTPVLEPEPSSVVMGLVMALGLLLLRQQRSLA